MTTGNFFELLSQEQKNFFITRLDLTGFVAYSPPEKSRNVLVLNSASALASLFGKIQGHANKTPSGLVYCFIKVSNKPSKKNSGWHAKFLTGTPPFFFLRQITMSDKAVENVVSEIQKGHDIMPLIQHLTNDEMKQFNADIASKTHIDRDNGAHAMGHLGGAEVLFKKGAGGQEELSGIMFNGHSIYHASMEGSKGADAFTQTRGNAPAEALYSPSSPSSSVENCMAATQGKRVIGVDLAVCKAE